MAKGLTTAEFSSIAKALDRFRYGVVSDARKNLARKQPRTSGSGRSYQARINAGMTLSRSLKSSRRNLSVSLSMEEYGQYVDQGRLAGKMPPRDPILQWIKDKPIRLRDEKGRFMEKTDARMNSLAFLIQRSIGEYGTKPTHFFTVPFETRLDKLYLDIDQGLEDDFNLLIEQI